MRVVGSVVGLVVCCYGFGTLSSAYSTGAPECPGGRAAVGGPHVNAITPQGLLRTVAEGSLSDGATTLSIGGTILAEGSASTFSSGTDLFWSVEAFQVEFIGLLVRVQAADAENTFTLTSNNIDMVPLDACELLDENVKGITHTSSVNRQFRGGYVRWDGSGSVTVEVTAVYVNDDETSLYAYSNYSLTIQATTVPTQSPTRSTVNPTVDPTIRPEPTSEPTQRIEPTTRPVTEPTIEPTTLEPTTAPTMETTNDTSTIQPERTAAPTMAPTGAVSTAPSPSPGPRSVRNQTQTFQTVVNTALEIPIDAAADAETVIVEWPLDGFLTLNQMQNNRSTVTYSPKVDFVGADAFAVQVCIDTECRIERMSVMVVATNANSTAATAASPWLWLLMALVPLGGAVGWYRRRGRAVPETKNGIDATVPNSHATTAATSDQSQPVPSSDTATSDWPLDAPARTARPAAAMAAVARVFDGAPDYKDQCRADPTGARLYQNPDPPVANAVCIDEGYQ